ncbi:hypothetical protein V1264_024454 [Littorina saxatilis]|uniref:Secreted protein n=1 Tax=Littorina saxatilis TaxID=31220 RepID=A0AAN9ALE9_9CAEN
MSALFFIQLMVTAAVLTYTRVETASLNKGFSIIQQTDHDGKEPEPDHQAGRRLKYLDCQPGQRLIRALSSSVRSYNDY